MKSPRPFRTAPLRALMATLIAAAAVLASEAAADSIATDRAFLPAVHVNGATGVFRTDVTVFNPDTSRHAVVKLYFAEAEKDGSTADGFQFELAPRESQTLVDLLCDPSLWNYCSGGYGLLEVIGEDRTGHPTNLIVTSNTYNVAGAQAGTYGQFIPGQPYRKALGFDDSVRGDLYTIGLPADPVYRVNAVVMNPTDRWLEAGVQLVDGAGYRYGTRIKDVPPYSMVQMNDVFGKEFAAFGPFPEQYGPYRLTFFVNLANGARVLGYATITDTRTGDPYLVTAEPVEP